MVSIEGNKRKEETEGEERRGKGEEMREEREEREGGEIRVGKETSTRIR